VNDVRVTSISSDGDRTAVESGGDVYLQQGTSLGVGCTATTNGSRVPPTVTVLIGDEDVTANFTASEELDFDALAGGLTFYQIIVRLTYVTRLPDRRLHGKRLVCTASRDGFDDVSATSLLLVRCKSASEHTRQKFFLLRSLALASLRPKTREYP